jgi:hypothetical protein
MLHLFLSLSKWNAVEPSANGVGFLNKPPRCGDPVSTHVRIYLRAFDSHDATANGIIAIQDANDRFL